VRENLARRAVARPRMRYHIGQRDNAEDTA
jgi:hypothetical protein